MANNNKQEDEANKKSGKTRGDPSAQISMPMKKESKAMKKRE